MFNEVRYKLSELAHIVPDEDFVSIVTTDEHGVPSGAVKLDSEESGELMNLLHGYKNGDL